jgi:hypothetical protein
MRSASGDWRLFQPLRAPCACQELLASVAKRACLHWRKRLKSLKPIDGMLPCNSGAEASGLRLRDWMRQPAPALHLRGMQRGCQSNPCKFPVWALPRVPSVELSVAGVDLKQIRSMPLPSKRQPPYSVQHHLQHLQHLRLASPNSRWGNSHKHIALVAWQTRNHAASAAHAF